MNKVVSALIIRPNDIPLLKDVRLDSVTLAGIIDSKENDIIDSGPRRHVGIGELYRRWS
jgi:hypothetical protein